MNRLFFIFMMVVIIVLVLLPVVIPYFMTLETSFKNNVQPPKVEQYLKESSNGQR